MKNIFLTILLFAASAFAQNTPPAVTTDPPRPADRKLAARMVELHVPAGYMEQMNGILYLAAGEGPHPTVILLHGFPGNEQNLDLAQSVRRAGWNVLYFHYRGAWGSQGSFSFANAMKDTQSAVNFLHAETNVKKYGIDTERIVLIGHSMGGFMAAYAAAHKAAICGVVLMSPWNLGADVATHGTAKELADELEEFRGYELALHGFSAETGTADIRSHAKEWELTGFAPEIARRRLPVLLTYGAYEDNRAEGFTRLQQAMEKAGVKDFKAIKLPTDHAYSDQRIALQSAVVDWLERFQRSPHGR